MKTTFATNMKDNIAAAALLAATFITIVGGLATSSYAHADKSAQSPARQVQMLRMEAIVVTAPRNMASAIKS